MTGWQLDSDSPLLGLDDGRRRAHFEVSASGARPSTEVPGLLAGVAEADLTPPPGMPKAGYSSNAHDGVGFRTRLRARVLHLRSGLESVAIVQCDLLGGSAVLQHLVARAIAETTDVPLAGLFIGATHTHAGPGQFLGTDFYNRFASNHSGFDPAWTQFLVRQIATAVESAVATREPALVATGSSEVWGLTRNRSLPPHLLNPEVADKRTEPQRKFFAVNPLLHLVRVDRRAPDGGTVPLGSLVVFSVHGTGIPVHVREYNADLWAYVVGELRHRVESATGASHVVGAIQGTHADLAPAIRPGVAGYLEARRIGTGIGEVAAALHARLESELTDQVSLACGLREVRLDESSSIEGIELPARPAVGASLLAGATENTTPVIARLPPFRAGSPKRSRAANPQGAKWVVGSRWLQPLFLPTRAFPRILPIQIIGIGSLHLVGMPFEITLETGRRIQESVARVLPDAGTVAVSSVANEYSGYAATPEEYALQFYEGGHTLYGPKTQPFLSAHAARLARDIQGQGFVSEVCGPRRFNVGVRRFLIAPAPSSHDRRAGEPAHFVDPTPTVDGYWEFEWWDGPPGNLSWHEPLVSVESADGHGSFEPARRAGRVVDDQGWDLEVTHRGAGDAAGEHRYRVRWYDPELRAGRRHRFVLLANAGRPEVTSEPFD
jgi:neutral ceramidase